MPNAEIKIRRVQGDDYAIEKINGQDYPNEAQPLVQQPAEHTFGEDLGQCEADPSIKTLRVLMLYTDATLTAAGSLNDLRAQFIEVVGEANLALKNSKIRVRFVPIAFEKANVATSKDQNKYLKSLADDGAIKQLRDAQKAHTVSLLDIDFVTTTNWCGISWLMTDKNKKKDLGYNIIDWSCALNNLSWIHEVGHNMGAQHNKMDADGPGLFPYSYGLRWPNQFRTIMVYPCGDTGNKVDFCSRIPRFTNPDIKFSGLAIGDKASADNARTLNQSRCIVASWYGNSPVSRAFPVEK